MFKDFFSNQPKSRIIVKLAVLIPLVVLTLFLSDVYKDKRRREFDAKRQQELAEITAEAQRRHLAAKSQRGESQTERTGQFPPVDRIKPSTTDMTPEPPSTEKKQSVELMTSGPLKGMPVEDAKAFARQHLADSKAWHRRRDELERRRHKNIDQTIALALASSNGVDDKLSTMLSVFKLMSDEQLEGLRKELLKTKPAEEVNALFDDLVRSSTKTPEQITRDAKEILKSREAYRAARRELQVESEQIQLEYAELERTKPF